MKLLLSILEDISSLAIEWYGSYVKKIIVGGKSFETLNERDETIYLLALDKVSKISFYARGEIFIFFYNKILKSSENVKKFIDKYKTLPKIYGIIVEPKELDYEMPLFEYLINNGKILFNR
ncbi:MAG: hypothetical protein QXY68_03065 [Saccharolobus sp.]